MSSSPTRRRLLRRLAGREQGFTVIELMVALTVLAILAAGLVPLLVAASRADQLTKQLTQAKSLSVARLAAMRALPFHVDAQNGAYLDVLDEYYTNASTTANCVAATGGNGRYATGTVPGQSSSSAFYQTDFSATPCTAGAPSLPTGFTQSVYVQFLSAATASGATRSVLTPPSTYDSQTSGVDSPVSPLVGVTVVTSYSTNGTNHSYRTYTEIADAGHDRPLVNGQAGATALTVDSHASDGSLLSLIAGQVGMDGTVSSTSNATATAVGARFSRVDSAGTVSYADVNGAAASVAAPPIPSSAADATSGSVTAGSVNGSCGWGSAGPTATSNVSATISSSSPRVPATVEQTPAPSVTATVRANGGTGSCGALAFTNSISGTVNSALGLSGSSAQVLVPDLGGNGAVMQSTGYLDTPALATSQPIKSAGTAVSNGWVELFPNLSFVTDNTYNKALIAIQVSSATITCASNATGATASYSGTVKVWTQASASSAGGYQTVTFSWTSGSAVPTTLPALSTTVNYANGVAQPLSTWLQSWQFNGLVEQAPATGKPLQGRHTIPGVISIDTQPTLQTPAGAPDPATDLLVSLSRVSCVSEDNR